MSNAFLNLELMRAPENMQRQAVVIYHANCADGFGAAWTFHRYAESSYGSVQYQPKSYGDAVDDDAPMGRNVDLYILDFSFKREYLRTLCNHFKHVCLIDHHKTCGEDLQDWINGSDNKPENLSIIFDTNYSGAMLTHMTFAPEILDETLPSEDTLVAYVQDRDLWKFHLPYSKAVNMYIANTPKVFESYDALNYGITQDFDGVIQRGLTQLEQFDSLCQSIVANAHPISFELSTGSYHGMVCNCPGEFSSEVGNILAGQSGSFGCTWFQSKDRSAKFSLRSIGDYDVTRIAKEFGGGGHKNASGFSLGAVSAFATDGEGRQPTFSAGATIWSPSRFEIS